MLDIVLDRNAAGAMPPSGPARHLETASATRKQARALAGYARAGKAPGGTAAAA